MQTFRLEVRGSEVLGGGSTPDELYGVGIFGPAIFGVLNRTGLPDAEASTFVSRHEARLALLALVAMAPSSSVEFRIQPLADPPAGAVVLEVRGPEVLGGGSTPDELYGVGIFGPAVFGVLNRTGLPDAEASTFTSDEQARLALQALLPYPGSPQLEFRIRPVE